VWTGRRAGISADLEMLLLQDIFLITMTEIQARSLLKYKNAKLSFNLL